MAPQPGEVADDLNDAGTELAAAANAVKDEAAAQFEQLQQTAQQQIAETGEQAKAFVTDRKGEATESLEHVSKAVRHVANDLGQTGETAAVAGYVRDIAGGIDRLSETLRNNSVDQLVGMAQDFGRRQPLALLGAAAVAGFAASRFIMASADRSTRAAPTASNQGGAASSQPGEA